MLTTESYSANGGWEEGKKHVRNLDFFRLKYSESVLKFQAYFSTFVLSIRTNVNCFQVNLYANIWNLRFRLVKHKPKLLDNDNVGFISILLEMYEVFTFQKNCKYKRYNKGLYSVNSNIFLN